MLHDFSYDPIPSEIKIHSEICQKLEGYIALHISEKILVRDIAIACSVSERTLYYIFRNHYHQTITEYIQKERLSRAAVLLTMTNRPIAQIALSLGFTSNSYFAKQFLCLYGLTPTQYRRHYLV